MDWKRELVVAHLVKQKVAEADVGGLWEHILPEVAATERDIDAVERELGFRVDPQYRAFLLHADGWRAFHHTLDIFGTRDLLGGDRAEIAAEILATFDDLQAVCGIDQKDLVPVAVASNSIDIMLMARPHAPEPGKVFWFAGQLIDTFPGFDEFFLAMVDYNRLEYQRLVDDSSGTVD